jgi:hypothetical protein
METNLAWWGYTPPLLRAACCVLHAHCVLLTAYLLTAYCDLEPPLTPTTYRVRLTACGVLRGERQAASSKQHVVACSMQRYSDLIAITGSMRDALWAGTKPASNATPVSKMIADANVVRSVAPMPNS